VETDRRSGDPAFLVADSSSIRRELGWRPHYENLAAIIETAWTWHRKEMTRNNPS
jgi:UDP-glucose 4-epimerase